jgi:hypothetical protein
MLETITSAEQKRKALRDKAIRLINRDRIEQNRKTPQEIK